MKETEMPTVTADNLVIYWNKRDTEMQTVVAGVDKLEIYWYKRDSYAQCCSEAVLNIEYKTN